MVCGFTLHDEFWITNGTAIRTVTAVNGMVSNHQRSISSLPGPFFDGVCKTFGHGKVDKTWMCFAREGTNLCQSFDGLNFVTEAKTRYNRNAIRLGNYRGAPIAIGGLESLKTEVFKKKSDRWTLTADFPFASDS